MASAMVLCHSKERAGGGASYGSVGLTESTLGICLLLIVQIGMFINIYIVI